MEDCFSVFPNTVWSGSIHSVVEHFNGIVFPEFTNSGGLSEH